MENKTIKAFIDSYGEPSVGINGAHTELDLDIYSEDCDEEERNLIRKYLSDLFTELWDDSVNIRLSDECPHCGKTSCDRKCLEREYLKSEQR